MATAIQQTQTSLVSALTSKTILLFSVRKGSVICLGISLTSGGTVSTVSDGVNTYTQRVANTTNAVLYVYTAENVTGGNLTITVTFGASTTGAMIAREYGNVATDTTFDQLAVNNSAASTSLTSTATGTLSRTSELVIAFGATGASTTFTVGAGYKNMQSVANTAAIAIENKTVYENASVTGIFTISGSLVWACAVITIPLNSGATQKSIRPHPFSPGLAR